MSKHQVVGYIRVSSVGQNTDRQLDGVELDRVFEEKVSAATTARPQLQAALQYVREGDTLVVHSMDRLARNTEDLLRLVRELAARKVSVRFEKERMTFTGDDNPMNQLMLTLLGAVAQFERSLIRERQQEGIEQAKKKGSFKGGKPKLKPEQVEQIKLRAAGNESKTAIAAEFGISRETLYSYLRAAAVQAAA